MKTLSTSDRLHIENHSGLSVKFLENGLIESIESAPTRIGLKSATAFTKAGLNLYLRKRTGRFEYKALLGPGSRFEIAGDSYSASGNWAGLEYRCQLRLSKKSRSWQWRIDVTNNSSEPAEFDLFYVQDIGLKPVSEELINEYYVSQYLDRRVLRDTDHGAVICCRQNMKEPTGHPWLMMACGNHAIGASVDGIAFYGKNFRETGIPEGLLADVLKCEYAGESSILALQEAPFMLTGGGGHHRTVFFATYLQDHPLATSEADLKRISVVESEFAEENTNGAAGESKSPVANIFNIVTPLPVEDLSEEELDRFFGKERRHREIDNEKLLSFFCKQNTHVVLRPKETLANRPHAHILQSGPGFAPDENIASTTAFAFGVFNSHLSQGNTNFNVFLSICTNQFNLEPETGQRIIVDLDGRKYLLGVPSAFEMGLNYCRWIYKFGDHCFQVRSWTSKTAPQVNMDFKVLSGGAVDLSVTHDFDRLNGWSMTAGEAEDEYIGKPDAGSMIAGKFPQARFRIIVQAAKTRYKACGDEALCADPQSRESRLFILDVPKTDNFCVSFVAEVCARFDAIRFDDPDMQWSRDCDSGQTLWRKLCANLELDGKQDDVAAIKEILPWFGMNALIHFLTPYGLEQFSGAAWGTRDVSQGPLDLLLSTGKYEEARLTLCKIFSNQHPEGGWPQWWMFDKYSNIRAEYAHGDVVYWPLIGLSNYIKTTGDLNILEETLPYYQEKSPGHLQKASLSEHVDRTIRMIVDSFIPGTALVPFGGGDWNDSLQPVSKDLGRRMISSWTVEMNYQAFRQLQAVCELNGDREKASRLDDICERIKADFNKYLIKDGTVAGYGLVEPDRDISVMLHPRDTKTGVHYSLLPMNRGIISEIFTPEQARHHQEIIERHLKGPDGARLMDRPLKYKGGIQEIFQRAESSAFFGREIGLMYVHEHLRYAESLAITGKPDAFIKALRQANPVAYREIVPCGDIRQSNCYYSSSDAEFKNRYEADERYDEIKAGKITLNGGWRVYSSGPGIYLGLIISRLLGLRIEFGKIVMDPVLPRAFDGFSASLNLLGRSITFHYSVKEDGFGPKAVIINGVPAAFTRKENKYRRGGAVVPTDRFLAAANRQRNTIEIQV